MTEKKPYAVVAVLVLIVVVAAVVFVLNRPSTEEAFAGEAVRRPGAPTRGEPTTTPGYRYVEWSCYDGFNGKQGSPSSCKTRDVWRTLAEQSCAGRVGPTGKTGVSSFSVSEECRVR